MDIYVPKARCGWPDARRHARAGGHPVRRSTGDLVADALEYSIPAFAVMTLRVRLRLPTW